MEILDYIWQHRVLIHCLIVYFGSLMYSSITCLLLEFNSDFQLKNLQNQVYFNQSFLVKLLDSFDDCRRKVKC